MATEGDQLDDSSPIDFRFSTFGELSRVFGEKRARAMVRALRRKEASAAQAPSREDVEMALRFLRGDKTGPQASRALRALRAFFGSSERARKACQGYLEKLLADGVAAEDG